MVMQVSHFHFGILYTLISISINNHQCERQSSTHQIIIKYVICLYTILQVKAVYNAGQVPLYRTGFIAFLLSIIKFQYRTTLHQELTYRTKSAQPCSFEVLLKVKVTTRFWLICKVGLSV
ncbi:hypothetical protein EB796_005465 [Bugula neritina]|uniref:Uncharacterized protein n=1 Tax=Bugula neritina TaxID=10212 RepID=A0A7J7KE82_BUGNE|nr:hypothetical protein EB796_005465 [Bugula neritina]